MVKSTSGKVGLLLKYHYCWLYQLASCRVLWETKFPNSMKIILTESALLPNRIFRIWRFSRKRLLWLYLNTVQWYRRMNLQVLQEKVCLENGLRWPGPDRINRIQISKIGKLVYGPFCKAIRIKQGTERLELRTVVN